MVSNQTTITLDLPGTTTNSVTSAGNQGWYLQKDYGLYTNDQNFLYNTYGAKEEWLRGNYNIYGNLWYVVLPLGTGNSYGFYAWDGTWTGNGTPGTLLTMLSGVFWWNPALEIASGYSQRDMANLVHNQYQLNYTAVGFNQNWGGLNERWIRSAINAWYFILPNGQFYKWDGGNNLATSTLFANLSPDCYTNINSRLRDSTASPVSVSVVNNTQLVIAPLNGYIGDYWAELDRYTGTNLISRIRYHVGFMSSDPNSLGQDWASETVATTAYSYDDDGRLTHLQQTTATGTNIANYTYTYDNASRVTTEKRNSTTVTYTYDNAAELTGDGTATFTYDATGNRTNTGDTTTTGNQLTSDGTWNYGYDVAGNETSKTKITTGEIWTYGYNLKNQMTSAVEKTSGGAIEMQVNYKYDVFGNRIEQDVGTGTAVVTRFAYDGTGPVAGSPVGNENWNVWADLDGNSSLTTRYLHGDATDQLFARMDGNAPYFYLTDRMGSVRDVIDYNFVTVTVRDSITYDGYGNITAETNSSYRGRYTWTGREFDVVTGLQYNRARYYDPKTGRWTSQDPLGFDAGDSNLYRYVNNDPTEATDPSGMDYLNINNGIAYWVQGEPGQRSTSKGFYKLSTGQQIRLGTVEGNSVTYDDAIGGGTSSIAWLTQHIARAGFVSDGITWEGGYNIKASGGFWKQSYTAQIGRIDVYFNGISGFTNPSGAWNADFYWNKFILKKIAYDATVKQIYNGGCIGVSMVLTGIWDLSETPATKALKAYPRFSDAQTFQRMIQGVFPNKVYRIVGIMQRTEDGGHWFLNRAYTWDDYTKGTEVWSKIPGLRNLGPLGRQPFDFLTLQKPAGKPAYWTHASGNYSSAREVSLDRFPL